MATYYDIDMVIFCDINILRLWHSDIKQFYTWNIIIGGTKLRL